MHISLNNSIIHINNLNDAFILLKQYTGIYNDLFTPILSISCLADNPLEEKCKSVVNYYEEDILHKKEGPSFQMFLYWQNKGFCQPLISTRGKFLNILSSSSDETLNSLVNSEMTTFFISQNITTNGTKLIAYKQNNSFIDMLNYITSGFLILTSNPSSLKDVVYIMNRINYEEEWSYTEDLFKDIKINKPLTQYQYQYYYLILNYQIFLKRLDQISINLLNITSNAEKSNLKTIKIVIIITLIAYIFLQGIIYLFIQKYYAIIAELLFDIEKKMNLKNDEISVREMFLQKIEKLKIIISLYKQDIYQAIVDLNFIYDNYKKFIEEKNKELAKYLKRDKLINENNFNDNKSKKEIQKNISSIKSNVLNIYFIVFCDFVSIIISIILFLIWNSYESIYDRIFYLVSYHGNLSNDAYIIINYYQLMIYNSIIYEDINKYEGFDISKGEDLFHKLYNDLEGLYEARKYMRNLKKYNLDSIDKYFDHNCSSFYDELYNTYKYSK